MALPPGSAARGACFIPFYLRLPFLPRRRRLCGGFAAAVRGGISPVALHSCRGLRGQSCFGAHPPHFQSYPGIASLASWLDVLSHRCFISSCRAPAALGKRKKKKNHDFSFFLFFFFLPAMYLLLRGQQINALASSSNFPSSGEADVAVAGWGKRSGGQSPSGGSTPPGPSKEDFAVRPT